MFERSMFLAAGLALAGAAQAPTPTPPAGPAPLRQLLARGVSLAPVQTGLSFAVTITEGGRSLLAGPWILRVPGASGALKLTLERTKLEGGYLEAAARIRNDSGALAGGVRLDFVEIAEGAPVPTNAPARVSGAPASRSLLLDSPLYFGDLEPRAEAAIFFRLGPLGLTPGSPYAVLRGVITGVAFGGTVEIPDSSDATALDSDGEGRVYAGDGAGQAIFRLGPEAGSLRKISAGCPVTGVAVRKKSGEVYATCREVTSLLRLPSSGRLTRTEPIGRALGPIRFGGKGFLYGAAVSIVRLDGLSIAEEIKSVAGEPLRAASFDVDADGTIWAVTADREARLLRIRSARDIVVEAGPGDGLGSIAQPRSCRVGPDGALYVLEAASGEHPPRVTVFDGSGNLLRAWNPAMQNPVDLAFGSQGRLLVLWKHQNGKAAVSIYRPF